MNSVHLILFFSRGISLQTWVDIGSLEREISLYRCLQQKGIKVSFVTYGGKTDLQYSNQLEGIEILCNRWDLSTRAYERLVPWLHARSLSKATLIKTNQTDGADIALRAARLWRKPLLARGGYMWSDLMQSTGNQTEANRARVIERSVFTRARAIVVTTPSMKQYVLRNYPVSDQHVHVIPNFVLTDVFSPQETRIFSRRICFIGRLDEVKNLFSLLEACAGLDVDVHFIGGGHLRPALQEKAATLGVPLTLHGNLPHSRLPDEIRQSEIFALVSHHEGHPKTLLEAMSCGATVLGANSPGIREQIVHGETGWLVGTDTASIRSGIQHLLASQALRERLGVNARRFILKNYSLEKIVTTEFALYQEIIKQ